MILKIGVKKALGWIGTLSGRLTILLIGGLAITQATTLAYLVEKHEEERALNVDRAFFATLARASQTLAALPREERARVLRSMDSGGLSYWVAAGPALAPSESIPSQDSPPLPEAWGLIASDDKRAAWYEDRRPLSMKYRVYLPPAPPSARIEESDVPPDSDGPPSPAEGERMPPGTPLASLEDLERPKAKPEPRQRADVAFAPAGERPPDGNFEAGRPRGEGPPPERGRSYGARDANGQPVPEW